MAYYIIWYDAKFCLELLFSRERERERDQQRTKQRQASTDKSCLKFRTRVFNGKKFARAGLLLFVAIVVVVCISTNFAFCVICCSDVKRRNNKIGLSLWLLSSSLEMGSVPAVWPDLAKLRHFGKIYKSWANFWQLIYYLAKCWA